MSLKELRSEVMCVFIPKLRVESTEFLAFL